MELFHLHVAFASAGLAELFWTQQQTRQEKCSRPDASFATNAVAHSWQSLNECNATR